MRDTKGSVRGTKGSVAEAQNNERSVHARVTAHVDVDRRLHVIWEGAVPAWRYKSVPTIQRICYRSSNETSGSDVAAPRQNASCHMLNVYSSSRFLALRSLELLRRIALRLAVTSER